MAGADVMADGAASCSVRASVLSFAAPCYFAASFFACFLFCSLRCYLPGRKANKSTDRNKQTSEASKKIHKSGKAEKVFPKKIQLTTN